MRSILTCPTCGAQSEPEMPADACIFFLEREVCHALSRPKTGDCRVFCSCGSLPCPPVRHQRDMPTRFSSFDDYREPFLGGQGPAPAHAMSLDEAARVRLRDRIRERLPFEANGSVPSTARAWAARATVAA